MATAARRPAAMASTTVAGPVSQSPPAKTPVLLVSRVSLSACDGAPGGQRADVSPGRRSSTSWPMARMMVSAGMVNSEPGIGSGRRRPLSSGSPSCHLLADHTGHAAVLADHGDRRGEQQQIDAFLLGLVHLVGGGGHLFPGAAVDHGHFAGSQTDGRAGGVDGGEASADHQRPAQGLVPSPGVALAEEVDGRSRCPVRLVGAGDAAGGAALGADGQIDGVVAVGLEVVEGEVLAEAGVRASASTPSLRMSSTSAAMTSRGRR